MFELKNTSSTNVTKSNPYINFDLRSFLLPGINAVVQKLIDESDTAAHFGSGSLGHLIATPAFVALMINAAVMTVEDRLPPGMVTVGRALNFIHDAPTCLGMMLRVKATLKEINGDRLIFDIVASDDYGEIGSGTHERAVVDRTNLFAKADERINRV